MREAQRKRHEEYKAAVAAGTAPPTVAGRCEYTPCPAFRPQLFSLTDPDVDDSQSPVARTYRTLKRLCKPHHPEQERTSPRGAHGRQKSERQAGIDLPRIQTLRYRLPNPRLDLLFRRKEAD